MSEKESGLKVLDAGSRHMGEVVQFFGHRFFGLRINALLAGFMLDWKSKNPTIAGSGAIKSG